MLFICSVFVVTLLETMGQSITTPLSLTLQHWRDVQDTANNQSVDVHKKKWVTFCSSEWPTFNVGWPRDRTFNIDIISQVKAKVMDPGPQGHRDQTAYIVTWEALAYDPPPWVKPFVTPKCPPPTPSAPALPPPLLPTPARPPTRSSLYPALTKTPQVKNKEKPLATAAVLPPGDDLLVDLLTEEPPLYQDPAPSGEAAPASPS